MAVKAAKRVAKSTLLDTALDGMEDLFDFKIKEEENNTGNDNVVGIREMEFSEMEPFPNHKFKLYTGQRLQDMVDSIREFGILEPLIVWKHDGKNIILSGHNRQNAGKLAGLTRGPVVIKENLTYEDAVLIATESNLRQRSFGDLSPSEKAFCLKQHYDAIKRQGKRTDLLKELDELVGRHENGEKITSLGNPKKSDAGAAVGEEYGLSKDRIARYLRIATLIPPLLDCLDAKRIGFESAYDISFVQEELQPIIAELLVNDKCRMDTKKASALHAAAKEGRLTEEMIRQILTGGKDRIPKQGHLKTIRIKGNVLRRFFTEELSQRQIEDTVIKALEYYFERKEEKTDVTALG